MPPRRRRNVNQIPDPIPEGNAPVPPNLADIIAQAVAAGVATALQHQQLHPQPPLQAPAPIPVMIDNGWDRMRISFMRGNPPEFSGSTEVTAAHQWKKDIERHLRMVQCTEVQKQILATFKLVGDALQWWESVTTLEERATLTYNQFRDRFDDKYFPFAVRAAKKREFLNLQQGDRIVAEYEQEFTSLSLFAPEEVNTEEKRKNCFVHGLAWPIQQVIVGNPAYATYAQVVDAALQHCQIRRDYKKSKGDKRKDNDSTSQTVEKGNGQSGRHSDKGRFQGHQPWKKQRGTTDSNKEGPSHQGQYNGAPQISQGQQQGQRKPTGPFKGHCYGCGEYGHSAKRCPKATPGQQGQQGNTSYQGQRQPPPLPAPQVPRLQGSTYPALPAPPPPQGQTQQQLHYGRVYNIMPPDVQAPRAIEGMFPIYGRLGRVLFDTGASHSFISRSFVALSGLPTQPSSQPLRVSTPLGADAVLRDSCVYVPIEIGRLQFLPIY